MNEMSNRQAIGPVGERSRRSGKEEREGGAGRRSGKEEREGGAGRRSGKEEREGGAGRRSGRWRLESAVGPVRLQFWKVFAQGFGDLIEIDRFAVETNYTAAKDLAMAGKCGAGDNGNVAVTVFGADRLVQFDGVAAVDICEVDIEGYEVGPGSAKLSEGIGRIGSDSDDFASDALEALLETVGGYLVVFNDQHANCHLVGKASV
jgi:hypothetical protein